MPELEKRPWYCHACARYRRSDPPCESKDCPWPADPSAQAPIMKTCETCKFFDDFRETEKDYHNGYCGHGISIGLEYGHWTNHAATCEHHTRLPPAQKAQDTEKENP